MIVKGGSRGGPGQLARHLQRTDTNERVKVLELQSGLSDLAATFRDWQTLSEGTRGVKGLYHVNIDPDARYAMTEAQWMRAVDVLEKELGLDGQPRAVVMHEKHGREHIHVVWARTDIETMTLWDDGYNYLKHERASLAMEMEFGHEHVPGKHAKRDREKQPEFPRADVTHAEWQQAERTGLSIEDRRAQLAALHSASDTGQAFAAALEQAGYVLAKGDSANFIIIDEAGDTFNLGREIKMKAPALRKFMADIDRDQLPTEAEAIAQQRDRQQAPTPTPDKVPEISKPETPEQARAVDAPAPLDRAGEDAPEKRGLDPAVAKALEERQAIELEKWRAWHGKLRGDLEYQLEREMQARMALLDERQTVERENLAREHKAASEDIWERLQRLTNPTLIAERVQARRREAYDLARRLAKEREDQLALERQSVELELEAQAEQHAEKLRQVEADFEVEAQRYLEDQERAAAMLADLQERHEAEQEHLEQEREDDEDYQEEERLERERNPWDDDPIRRSK